MPRLIRCLTLFGAGATLCLLITASAQATHPRPKSASPIQMSLVPAYAPCAAPNRTHGPPLAFASCHPPAQTSAQATVGTPDAFGGPTNATGFLRLNHTVPPPGSPVEPDMAISIALNDVRCVPAGERCGTPNASGPADYSGEMQASFTFRLTDHWNEAVRNHPATVQDFTIDVPGDSFPWTCVQSGSTSTGSACNLASSLDALIPGAVNDWDTRQIWELHAVQIHDGGADGDGDIFARPGVFIP